MITIEKLENKKVIVKNDDGDIIASFGSAMNIFRMPGVDTNLIITKESNPNNANGFVFSYDTLDQDNCVPVIDVASIDELLIELDSNFFEPGFSQASGSGAINTSTIFKTGADVSYVSNDDGDLKRGRGDSFFILDYLNGFGTNDRFTDTLGGQDYADNIVIDWAYWNISNGNVNAWYKIPEPFVANANSAISNQPYTKGAYNDWYIPNAMELISIQKMSIYRNFYNYAPFNISVLASNDRLMCSTKENSQNGYIYQENGTAILITARFDITNYDTILIRTMTLTELGL